MMRRKLIGTLFTVFLCVSLGSADLVLPRKRDLKQDIAGLRIRSYTDTFKPSERALVIVSGNYQSCLGLYVFDAQGNCVAKDDMSDPQAADDLVTEWIPAEQGRYSIEVRNAGIMPNSFQIAVR
jgi:hypothetical protein